MAVQLSETPGQCVSPCTFPSAPAPVPDIAGLGMTLSSSVFMEFSKGEAPNVLFQLSPVEQRLGWISSGPQSKCVGDSCNQHRGAYTVDEQKQLLEKKGKYVIFFLENSI